MIGSRRRNRRTNALAVVAVAMAAGIVAAGPVAAHEKLGKVHFPVSCSPAAQQEFDRAVALLHSFWFPEAAKAFNEVLRTDPTCTMAYWGLAVNAMGNPLAGPPNQKGLTEGAGAVARARNLAAPTQRERDYVAAIEVFYKDAATLPHGTRAEAYERAMEQVAARYPDDTEAAIFYALALNMTLNPSDKTYANQLKAGRILEPIFAKQPDHPGVAHYLIHSYDFPPIAQQGVPAARRYAAIAPSAPHALHMPSHIFTRLGYWEESIASNRASAVAAKDEVNVTHPGSGSYNALHAMDYMVYGYLQLAQDRQAAGVLEEIKGYRTVDVEHFAAAYAFAAMPARYALERRRWSEAAQLQLHPPQLSWQKFPQAEAVLVFARGLGRARSGDVAGARSDMARLEALRDALKQMKLGYWAEQTEIQRIAVSAWVARAEGRSEEALRLMREAAEREDATEKHPVTPGPLIPAREQLGELLLDLGQPGPALAAFEATHKVEPGRFHGLAGAARAAALAGETAKARTYYGQLVALAQKADTQRPEVTQARAFLDKK